MTGAYLTKDGGDSFTQINYPNGSYSFAFDPQDPEIIYIGSNALNRSSDGGKTWERIFPSEEDIIKEIYRGDHASFSMLTKEGSLYSTVGDFITVRNIKVDPNNPEYIVFQHEQSLFLLF